jgi:hypothetical protein
MVEQGWSAGDVAAAAVHRHFPPRRYAVCQNVSWALLPYEADVIAVSAAGPDHEIEIKTSKSDLLADTKKMRWANFPNRLRPQVDFYWLAVPGELEAEAVKRAEEIRGGVLSVYRKNSMLLCEKAKLPIRWINKDEPPMRYSYTGGTPVAEHRRHLRNLVWRLGSLRYWDDVFQRSLNRIPKEKENP